MDIQSLMQRISMRVQNFRQIRQNVWNFTCPLGCGDNATKKSRARGYVFQHNDHYVYKCHNCGESLSIERLLKRVYPDLYAEYRFDKYHNRTEEPKGDGYIPATIEPIEHKQQDTLSWIRLTDLDDNHPAMQWITKRCIPDYWVRQLYYADDYGKLVKELNPRQKVKDKKDPRICIPFREHFPDGKLLRVAGRSILPDEVRRYVYVDVAGALVDDRKVLFREGDLDTNRTFYVVEGQFDSMFLDNAIANGGSDLLSSSIVKDNLDDAVLVQDNEPRSKQIVKLMEKYIDAGSKIVIWPFGFDYKDINESICNGWTKARLMETLEQNTFQGLRAKAMLSYWRKD